MKKKRIGISIRLNPEDEADRKALEYMRLLDRNVYKSYGQVITMAINEFFDRQEQHATNSFLETREKEDAFLHSVLETIREGFQEAVRLGTAREPQQFPQGAVTLAANLTQDETTKKSEAIKATLDFLDSF